MEKLHEVLFGKKAMAEWGMVKELPPPPAPAPATTLPASTAFLGGLTLTPAALDPLNLVKTDPSNMKFVEAPYNDLVNLVAQIQSSNPSYFRAPESILTNPVLRPAQEDEMEAAVRDLVRMPYYRMILNSIRRQWANEMNNAQAGAALLNPGAAPAQRIYQYKTYPRITDMVSGTFDQDLKKQMLARGVIVLKPTADFFLGYPAPPGPGVAPGAESLRPFYVLIEPVKLNNAGLRTLLNMAVNNEKIYASREYYLPNVLNPQADTKKNSFNHACLNDFRLRTAGGAITKQPVATFRDFLTQYTNLESFIDDMADPKGTAAGPRGLSISQQALAAGMNALLEQWFQNAGTHLAFHLVTFEKDANEYYQFIGHSSVQRQIQIGESILQGTRNAYNKLRGDVTEDLALMSDKEYAKQTLAMTKKDLDMRQTLLELLLGSTTAFLGRTLDTDYYLDNTMPQYMSALKFIQLKEQPKLKLMDKYADMAMMNKGALKEFGIESFCGDGNVCALPEKHGFFKHATSHERHKLAQGPKLTLDTGKNTTGITISSDVAGNLNNLCTEGQEHSEYQLEQLGTIMGVRKLEGETSGMYCLRVKDAVKAATFNQ